MNRTDYLSESIVATMASLRERANVRNNTIHRDRSQLGTFLTEHGQDIATKDTIDDLCNKYLAGCLATDSERSAEMFRDTPELKEVNLDYYLGIHDSVRAIVSREYDDDEDGTIHNHLLIERVNENAHIEGIKRMASAYARVTFVDQE